MMNKDTPVAGQRWVSDTEPELGLGIVLKCEYGRAEIFFPAASEHRQYALGSAPIRRVRFQEGDSIKTHSGEAFVVDSITDDAGLLTYRSGSRGISEAELSDLISFSKPQERLLAGQVDELACFDLRVECLNRRRAMRQSPIRGFAGGRVDLIPHQISIASEVASRMVPRILLADEVGLGKTIEAGLILQRLHLTGRAERVLVVLPPALLNQWFVEMFRRFQMSFSIFDEERCASLDADGANPFLDSQLVLCGLDFLTSSPKRAQQAREAGWDLLVVDEAHHLRWTPDKPSQEYQLVESLATATPSLLLLTATPQQLGMEGHFARLRLLDPDRFGDLNVFLKESDQYENVAKVINSLLEGKKPSDASLFNGPRAKAHYEAFVAGDLSARDQLVASLLDEHGTGRVMFRNTRAALSGFPKRKAHLVPLDSDTDEIDAKVTWLISLLKDIKKQKVLLICKTRELAEDVLARLQHEIKISAAIFHEGLNLLQRDRNAAFFADEDGARILICSEIGSEGRNFQFAHHLVLFDVPDDPELLEQRIGRLDRIGQTSTIHIHVPFLPGSKDGILARWYHEALDAFQKNLTGATQIKDSFQKQIDKIFSDFNAEALDKLIAKSAVEKKKISKHLQRGHDRLLELNSCRPEVAKPVIEAIRRQDEDLDFEAFFIRVLDHLNVQVEELGSRSYLLKSGASQTASLPGLNPDGCMVTFSRARAIAREDIGFITPDHPLVRAAFDAVLGVETGNSVFGVWKSSESNAVFLEVHFVLECIAPPALHADRFLPATPLRVVVDQGLNDVSEDENFRNASIEKGDVFSLLDTPVFRKKHLPSMFGKAEAIVAKQKDIIVETAQKQAAEQIDREVERLEDLRQINTHVRPSEIEALKNLKSSLNESLQGATIRADALKLVLRVVS
jgi:ATP-dependent helicase HepA